MKRIGFILLALLLCGTMVFMGCKKKEAAPQSAQSAQPGPAYHIGIVTGTVSQSEDDLRGAEELIRRYGSVTSGGIIQHVTYPDNFMAQMEVTITQITNLASDPLMKAIIVNQAIPGTSEAFKRVRERRPDIILLAGEPHEDPLVIQEAATLAISCDFISRGYTIPWAAKQLGADTFVHISFPRHMSYESLGLRRQIFEAACNDMGIRFVFITAPDPTSDVGVAGAQQYILEQTPQWINQYGKNSVYFCTNDAHTEPLLKQLFTYGGMFVEADLPSPLMGYPGALGIDLSAEAGDFPAILAIVENAVKTAGGAGKFGTWAFSYGFTASAGLGEFAKRVLDGRAKVDSAADLYAALGEFTPGAKWHGGYYIDANTGVRARNQLLIYMDTYIMGQGFLPTTEQTVPEKYYQIKFQQQ
jgi:DNA-binding LacI/PurR family transcriptional regulator